MSLPTSLPTDFAVTAWKRQLDTALRIVEVLIEGAEKTQEIQLAAAVDAHAAIAASRKALEAVGGVADLAALQSKLFTDTAGKMPHYWSSLASNAQESQAKILKLVLEGTAAGGLMAMPESGASKDAFNTMINSVWTQWLEGTRRMYASPLGGAPAEKVA
jgi:hypothetical protein